MFETNKTESMKFPQNKKIPLLFLVIISLFTMIRFDRPLIRGDGVAYLAWVDSFALDHDFDLSNQAERLRSVSDYAVVLNWHNGKYVNAFPFGIAFLQYPFYRMGDLFLKNNWLNVNPDYFRSMQGVELPYSLWAMIGNNFMVLCTIIFAWHVMSRYCSPWIAAFSAWGVFVGTPLFYYATVSPLNSHAPGAFAAALMYYLGFGIYERLSNLGDNERKPVSKLSWVGMGLSAGLMVLTRWQLALIAVPLWALFLWRRQFSGLFYATLAGGISLIPLPLVWNYLFDSPFVIPYDVMAGHSFLRFPVNAHNVLFYTFAHSPILIISVIGVIKLWATKKELSLVLIVAFVLQILINGAALDWDCGETYGLRRMSEMYFLYAFATGIALNKWHGITKFPHVMTLLVRLVFVSLLLYNAMYILAYFNYSWTNTVYHPYPTPSNIVGFFLQQSNRWDVVRAIFRTHLGPPAWTHPGP